ncbi:hypothetical protein GE09DRAFT_1222509 [Coniochaeta sp. 2T2.1]|nr:hypothetical protein GE09DRAFT_1222509 [Coniochaeta sp. 2T2.1]
MTSTADNEGLDALYHRAIGDPSGSSLSEADNEELDALYRRAIADPSSLNRADINVNLDWVSPEDDGPLFRRETGGKSRVDLIAQALAHPEQLTMVECDLFVRAYRFVAPPLPPPTSDSLDLATRKAFWAAAIGEDEKRAKVAALKRVRVLLDEKAADNERQHVERMVQVKRRTGTRWIPETVVLEGGSGDQLWPYFRTIFVSEGALANASAGALRARFKVRVEDGEVPLGIRRDCFLVADEVAVCSDETKRHHGFEYKTKLPYAVPTNKQPPPTVFVHAAHPDYPDIEPSRSECSDGGLHQRGDVGEPKVYDFLIYALSEPESHIGGWETVYHQTEVSARYTSVFHHNPANSAPTYVNADVFRDIMEQHSYRHRLGQGLIF